MQPPAMLKKMPQDPKVSGQKAPPSRHQREIQKAGAPDVRKCDCDINTLETKGTPLKLTNEEVMQAFTDALCGMAVALGKQIDPAKLASDLKAFANEADSAGKGPSAGLIDEMVRTIEVRLLKQQ